MKVRYAVLASLAMFAAPIAAQGQGGQGMRQGMAAAAPTLDSLTAQLALTAEQQPKVAAVLEAYGASTKESQAFMTKMRESGDMASMRDNPDAMKHMTALRDARTTMTTDLKAILTAEQAAKYDALYPQRAGRRPGGE